MNDDNAGVVYDRFWLIHALLHMETEYDHAVHMELFYG